MKNTEPSSTLARAVVEGEYLGPGERGPNEHASFRELFPYVNYTLRRNVFALFDDYANPFARSYNVNGKDTR